MKLLKAKKRGLKFSSFKYIFINLRLKTDFFLFWGTDSLPWDLEGSIIQYTKIYDISERNELMTRLLK